MGWIRLQQSLKLIYDDDVDMDRLIDIIASIGFGVEYGGNILNDLKELLGYLEGYNNDEGERLTTLLQMISDYYLEHKAIFATVKWKTADTVLRCLVLDAIDLSCDMGNNIALEIAIKNALHQHQVTLPPINDPNNNDDDSDVNTNEEGEHGEAMDNRKSNGNGEIANNEESYASVVRKPWQIP